MENKLKNMPHILVIAVLLQAPHSSICISLEGTQETPEKSWLNLHMHLFVCGNLSCSH